MKSSNILGLFLFVWSAQASVIDSNYRARIYRSISVSQQIYGNILKSGYSTDCAMIPTDSQYLSAMAKKCGIGRALIKGLARFFNEPDAFGMGYQPIAGFKKVAYEDQAFDCSFNN